MATFKYFLRVLAMWCLLRILNSSALQTFFRYRRRINSGFGRAILYEDEILLFTNFARESVVT